MRMKCLDKLIHKNRHFVVVTFRIFISESGRGKKGKDEEK